MYFTQMRSWQKKSWEKRRYLRRLRKLMTYALVAACLELVLRMVWVEGERSSEAELLLPGGKRLMEAPCHDLQINNTAFHDTKVKVKIMDKVIEKASNDSANKPKVLNQMLNLTLKESAQTNSRGIKRSVNGTLTGEAGGLLKFPPGFKWGVATAAYQIEGGWDADEKGNSIWDVFVRQRGHIENGHTGDVACDSYNKYQQDIQMLKFLGVSMYRFSLSWPRLLPHGTVDKVNPAGVRYYRRLIDGLLGAGITPMVTLYHWDLPQDLQDRGGWGVKGSVKHFTDYADFCFKTFGDKVKHWITINEPLTIVTDGYCSGIYAPGVKDCLGRGIKVAHHLILAHTAAYRLYKSKYKHAKKGQVGITLNAPWMAPLEPNNPGHVNASLRNNNFRIGWFAHPLAISGDYAPTFKSWLLHKAVKGSLPIFTSEEIKQNKGAYDFFGLNHYTTRYVTPAKVVMPINKIKERWNFPAFLDTDMAVSKFWTKSGAPWLYVVPWGIERMLLYVRQNYGNPPIYITENGYVDTTGTLKDKDRATYHRKYLKYIHSAIQAGCDVRGYMAWSLMDNFEWIKGYNDKFGLFHVNFTSPERTRSPKASAYFYKKVTKMNVVPDTV